MKSRITQAIKAALGNRLKAIIIFGSSVYLGSEEDLDIIVIVDSMRDLDEKISLEEKLAKIISSALDHKRRLDIHVFGVDDFHQNLKPGSFLSGLALGYEVLYGEEFVNNSLKQFFETLKNHKHVLVNRYGEWNLSRLAEITLRRRFSQAS